MFTPGLSTGQLMTPQTPTPEPFNRAEAANTGRHIGNLQLGVTERARAGGREEGGRRGRDGGAS